MKKPDVAFYYCKHCGNIIRKIKDSGAPVSCCSDNMLELVANTTDASQEKHVPVAQISNDTVVVKVGSQPHPMTDEHYIQWIFIETEDGFQVKYLTPSDLPEASFKFDGKLVEVYEYCNLHGLWKVEI